MNDKLLKLLKNPKVWVGIALIVAFLLGSVSDLILSETPYKLAVVICHDEEKTDCEVIQGDLEAGVDAILDGAIDEAFATEAPTLTPQPTPLEESTVEVTAEATEDN